ncbi:alpha/beta fold hydrolase [Gryllotalpicola kribbensis]|uniref:Alpha/beta fold hydrolase n=1 Tax=Gryllotalpicola kribbensis TaxID=993084 RepID=A0ABP8ANT6_9MICO
MSGSVVRTHPLGDLALDTGRRLSDAALVYEVHGEPAADGSNVILFPTFFMGTHAENRWLIGPGRPLDPRRYCIVVPNLLGNGVSTSPSNAAAGQRGADFPTVGYGDQVRAQRRLIREVFGVAQLHAVVGWSMGAAQALHWAVAFPREVERVFAFCGSARTSELNAVFLDSVEAAIRTDPMLADGIPTAGLRAAARVYAGWGFSGAFYEGQEYRTLGFDTREDFVRGFWEEMLLAQDPWNLITMIRTWREGDVGTTAGSSTDAALAGITARTAILSAALDMYFTPDQGARDAERIPGATFEVIPGTWGHSAGVGLNPPDNAFIDRALRELLGRDSVDLDPTS